MTQSPPPFSGNGDRAGTLVLTRSVRLSIVGTFVILAIGSVYYARDFFLPLALALLIALTLSPLVRGLSRHGIPSPLSALVIVGLVALLVAMASALLSGRIAAMLADAPAVLHALKLRFAFVQAPFERLNDVGREIQSLAAGDAGGQAQEVKIVQSGFVAWTAGTVTHIGTTLGATLILAVFILATGDTLRRKLVRGQPTLTDKKFTLRVLRNIENDVSRYLLTIIAINATLGVAVGLLMAFLGMPSPILWGLAAGILNFVPYLGGLIGISMAFAVAVVTFPTIVQACAPPLGYLALQAFEGQFATPTILGRRLELNIVAILIFLSFATWMWGIVGAVIGVPLLVVAKVFSDAVPALAPLAAFLSNEADTPEPTEPDPESGGHVVSSATLTEPAAALASGPVAIVEFDAPADRAAVSHDISFVEHDGSRHA